MSWKSKLIGLAVSIAIVFIVAALGATASVSAPDFYTALEQPSWAPPSWLFGPAWTTLYLLMAMAAWLIWCTGGYLAAKTALNLYLAQLVFNALWSWLFFAWRLGDVAFANIVIMWVLIATTMFFFYRIRPLAALLLTPYLAWVSFAGALNFTVWQMNPTLL